MHGLTTAAAVWESAAIGMAAGSGLLLLAVTVTAMHFAIMLGFKPLARRLAARFDDSIRLHIVYEGGRGVLRQLLRICGQRDWQLTELATDTHGSDPGQVGVNLVLSGTGTIHATQVLAEVDGVAAILPVEDEPE